MALYKKKFMNDAIHIPALFFQNQLLMLSEDTLHTCLLYHAVKP